MAEVVPMTRRLKSELPRLFAEHKELNALGDRLREAALAAGRTEYANLADALRLHTRTEEEVLYPAAIVLGDLVAEELRQRELVRA
ncbi:MAG: hemerythrin domain-containing protein [Burkholderiales bacterium]|nr:hemerythrin domain-containing protein [Burkholderiales bacterium]